MIHKVILPLVLVLFAINLYGQVVINEISYNPPESGNDSLEYIEIINAGNAMINIGGWYFLSGIEDTFPDVDLQPGDYFVTAISAQAMQNVFGISVHEWASGALSNSGELISLADSDGFVVDSVRFEDSDPWPTEPDGEGPSLELFDLGLDNNDGANWRFSGGTTGVIINGFEVSGTPGAENSGGGSPGPDLIIELVNFMFNPNVEVVAVGSVVRWVNNEGIAHNVNGQQSAFPGNPESFFSGAPASGPWQFEFQFLTAGTYHYKCDPHAAQGMTGTIYVYDPNIYNNFSLDELRLVNANGSALFDGVPTTISGVVHGVNFQPEDYSFYIIDENNVGINVFSFTGGSYVVTEGDALTVSGVIDQFNGQLEIIPDTIIVTSNGNNINTPRPVIELMESDEGSYLVSDLLKVDSVSNISASGFTIYATTSIDSRMVIRVDADAAIGLGTNEFQEGAWINVWGIGTQFDNSFPFTSGYQLLALEIAILIDRVTIVDREAIQMNPNPATDLIQLRGELTISEIQIIGIDGKLLQSEIVNQPEAVIRINNLPVGLHMVKATTDQGIWTSLLSVIR